MKTMCPPSYHHNGLVATPALGSMMYGYTLLVPMNQRVLNKLSKDHYFVEQEIKKCKTISNLNNLKPKINK